MPGSRPWLSSSLPSTSLLSRVPVGGKKVMFASPKGGRRDFGNRSAYYLSGNPPGSICKINSRSNPSHSLQDHCRVLPLGSSRASCSRSASAGTCPGLLSTQQPGQCFSSKIRPRGALPISLRFKAVALKRIPQCLILCLALLPSFLPLSLSPLIQPHWAPCWSSTHWYAHISGPLY